MVVAIQEAYAPPSVVPSPICSANTFNSKEPLQDKPIQGVSSEEVKIPIKPKKTPAPELVNGNGLGNSSRQQSELVEIITPAKRPHPEGAEDNIAAKKAKTAATMAAADKDDDVIIIDDIASGAIVIDDD